MHKYIMRYASHIPFHASLVWVLQKKKDTWVLTWSENYKLSTNGKSVVDAQLSHTSTVRDHTKCRGPVSNRPMKTISIRNGWDSENPPGEKKTSFPSSCKSRKALVEANCSYLSLILGNKKPPKESSIWLSVP